MEFIHTLSIKNNSVVGLITKDTQVCVMKYYPKYSRSMLIEINIMATSRHQNIMGIEQIVQLGKTNGIGIIMKKEEDILMEYLVKKKLSLIEKYHIILQIAYGIRYLHSNHILHLDLKCDNIMITNNVVKIIDFGCAEYMFDRRIFTCQHKCTVSHRAPEGFGDSRMELSTPFDIWSLGIVILEILMDMPIYFHLDFPSYDALDTEYDNKVYSFINSDKFKQIINGILPAKLHGIFIFDPSKRPNINQVIKIIHELTDHPERKIPSYDTNILPNYDINFGCIDSLTEISYYYKSLSEVFASQYPQIDEDYPCIIQKFTMNLLKRLALLCDRYQLGKTNIDHAIVACYEFFTGEYIMPIEKLIPQFNPSVQDEIIQSLIISTNGKIFQPIF